MPIKHMKRCSTPLVVREMQVGPTLRFPFTPLRWLQFFLKRKLSVGRNEEKLEPSHVAGGMENGAATVGNSFSGFQ